MAAGGARLAWSARSGPLAWEAALVAAEPAGAARPPERPEPVRLLRDARGPYRSQCQGL